MCIRDRDMYSGVCDDIPFKPDESEVFSMSGLADSLDLDMNGFGFMDMCGNSLPEQGGMAASPAQRILNDRIMRENAGQTRPRGPSQTGFGISADLQGMSFSYRDLLGMGMSVGTPTPGAQQAANDFLQCGIDGDL
eukprot:TRINITY_DN12598_c0_g1_i1.p1 TRINITY_DN12598_c0_g1~~TRINITY_DN12598_c0_g1_i1.p1  ORF type:complete len:136 (+),score=23.19 TRINITY_DN12598_c0_g1_i1:185-592(+)